ncbi:MAG: penicillin acylase family protein [Burkholderiales bacterium]|nr:penicillin acylase family protein [Burkholderiales bacterium]
MWRYLKWSACGLIALLVLMAAAVWLFMRASLPQLDGEIITSGVSTKVTATRDALGVPTISGSNRLDIAYATGYLHGQDRFFQMDLLRRSAAGELAALFGAAALPIDKAHRLHRFRARATAIIASMRPEQRALLDHYVAGVNAGLAALKARPFEYGLVGQAPQPWRDEDSLLVVWAMYFDLQGESIPRKLARGWVADHTTFDQWRLLMYRSTKWDAPLDAPAMERDAMLMGDARPEWLGESKGKGKGAQSDVAVSETDTMVGSNNMAVSGARTVNGAAIIENDMHLGIRLPHIWYRAEMLLQNPNGPPTRLIGVTLPGLPVVVAGSNGHVAWGFTNSYGDYLDLIKLNVDPANPLRYRVGQQWRTAQAITERIEVKGAPPVDETVRITEFGPVLTAGDKQYAVHWVAHELTADKMKLDGIEYADNLDRARDAANRIGMPAQNIVIADQLGHIAWTIAGAMPDRLASTASTVPYPAERATLGWQYLRAPGTYPLRTGPDVTTLWTANSRQLANDDDYAVLGDGGADMGARAQQLRDDLNRLVSNADERGVYAITLDDRAVYMETWRQRLLTLLDKDAIQGNTRRTEFRRLLVENWSGHASVDSAGYLLTREYMHALYAKVFGRADEEMKHLGGGVTFAAASHRWPEVLTFLLDLQPGDWQPPPYKTWREVELAALDAEIDTQIRQHGSLARATWGSRNTAQIMHPFAHFMPILRPLLAAPADMLPGDGNMPRVARSDFGQSERMVVSPGHEEQGIFNMPGGQSGHPLSPYFLAGHEAWVHGEPTHLLPGPAEHTLVFVPR